MRLRAVLAAFALAAAATLAGATAAAADSDPAANAVDDSSEDSLLDLSESLYCHVNAVLGNPPSCAS
ncbi:hypothetical protein [Streptomyces sp. NPDC006193]|uniref:hypothetical protein n=1 Tax=Streptomyces sp. NPDC006193 TaxID=3155717 RepID=UPI0033A45B65